MILLILLLLLLFILISNKENFNNKNKWIVLLTMCVKPNQLDRNQNEDINEVIEYRKQLYTSVINRWLKYTDLPIFVIESSGYNFPDISHDRLNVFSFDAPPKGNSSLAEANSLLYALDKLKDYNIEYTHILKVTGKYYLDNIEKTLNELPDDYDVYTQQHVNNEWRQTNTEYYGIKKELFNSFVQSCHFNMESAMYEFTQDKKVMAIPKSFSNDVKRNDGNIISNL